jgi:DNA-binding transcriptional LysR family regulator
MVLTPDGATLLPLAEKVIFAISEFAHTAASLHTPVRGHLRIGTILDPEFTRLGAFLNQLVKTRPLLNTLLHQDMSGNILALINRGELDVGFFLDLPDEPIGPPILRKILTRFTYRVLAPAGWRPQVENKDWKALAALPWLATPPSSVHNRLQKKVFGPDSLTGIEPLRVALVDQEASMLDLVRSGIGLSLVRDSIAMREVQTRGLVIANAVSLECELSFMCLAERQTDPVIAAAWAALDEIWG